MNENAVVFLSCVFGLLCAASLTGSHRFAGDLTSYPLPSIVAIVAIVLLGLNYQFSLSKDSSFAAALGLALLPLTFLLIRALGRWGWHLHRVLSILVLLIAVISLWNLVLNAKLPTLVLVDPNNYASLLYLALLPWMYIYLKRFWEGGRFAITHHIAVHLGFFVLLATLFATQSRTGLVIVGVALVLLLFVGVTRKQKLWPVCTIIAMALIAYPTVALFLQTTSTFAVDDLGRGYDVRAALNSAALNIFFDYPITGAGIYVFSLLYRFGRDPSDQLTAGIWVHNDYLQLLAEGGLILLAVLLCFVASTGWLFYRAIRKQELPGSEFGVLMALGAVWAHAFVNFVLFVPVLACFIGLSAALVPWQRVRGGWQHLRKRLQILVRILLLWGWVCFAYLLLDTFSAGVYQRQAGIPFASLVYEDLDRLLAYSRVAQQLNGNRGIPVFAEAIMYEQRLAGTPNSDFLLARTLSGYRRAAEVDPWNPEVLLRTHKFVQAYPQVRARLSEQEQPVKLLLRTLALEPIYLPAHEALIQYYERQGQPEKAYRVIREHLSPWLVRLTYRDDLNAFKYLEYLQTWAVRLGDTAYEKELVGVRQEMARVKSKEQLRM